MKCLSLPPGTATASSRIPKEESCKNLYGRYKDRSLAAYLPVRSKGPVFIYHSTILQASFTTLLDDNPAVCFPAEVLQEIPAALVREAAQLMLVVCDRHDLCIYIAVCALKGMQHIIALGEDLI